MTGDSGTATDPAGHYRRPGTAALPAAARTLVSAAARAAVSIGHGPEVLASYVALLDATPPALVPQLARMVANEVSSAHWRREQQGSSLMRALSARLWPRSRPVPSARPGLIADGPAIWLHIFDADGHARQAALARMAVPASPARLAALVLRLDDWVPQVRAEARAALARHALAIPDHVILACLPFITSRLDLPAFDPDGRSALVALLSDPRLDHALLNQFATDTGTASWRNFRSMLRTDRFDHHLAGLAESARHPAIRALALGSVLTGVVEGYPEWEDVVMSEKLGIRRRRMVRGRRESRVKADVAALIRRGATDRTLIVRKAAADGLIRHWRDLPDLGGLLSAFGADPGRSVEDRLDFIRRKAGL